MKKIRERVLEERWKMDKTELSFSCKEIELSPLTGQVTEGSFEIICPENMQAEGYVLADDVRIKIPVPWFCGNRETVIYTFDACKMEPGESREGYFQIISDCGEYRLPYRITAADRVLQSGIGEICSLQHFVNLARAYWQEAVQLFYHPDFYKILEPEEERIRILYRGFCTERGNAYHVDQFLTAAGKKQPVVYSCAQSQIQVTDLRGTVREELVITKNGWGAVGLTVRTEGEFLTADKKRLTEDSFLGNQCNVSVMIDEQMLHAGRNFGKVEFEWPEGGFSVEVVAESRNLQNRSKEYNRRQAKQYNLQLISLYEQLRTRRIDMESWQQQAAECADRLYYLTDKSVEAKLFKAHLFITQEKFEEAGWILEHAEPFMDEMKPAVLCYYLYLDTLYVQKKSYTAAVERRVKELFSQNPGEWRIAWLLLYLSEEINRNASSKWMFLESCFKQGCVSPVLYLEALQLLNANPALLPRLEDHVIRILYYGAKKRMLTQNLIGQILYMAGREKYYDRHLYQILCRCYEMKPDAEILQAICTLLIKGAKSGRKYFEWYAKGVEESLRITRLYEYYMMSLDLRTQVEIPRIILMYFAYQSDLEPEQAAYLYAYVQEHCKEDADLYAAYRPLIERFVTGQLQKGKISRPLAYLYTEIIQGPLLTADNALALARLLTRAEVDRKHDRTKLVIVRAKLDRVDRYVVNEECTEAELYSKEDLLLWQTQEGYLTADADDTKVYRLFSEREVFDRVAPFAAECMEYHLAVLDGEDIRIREDNVQNYLALTSCTQLERQYCRNIHSGLLSYFTREDNTAQLDSLLERIREEQVLPSEQGRIAGMLIQRGFYEKGYVWLAGTDIRRMDDGLMMRLCAGLLGEKTRPEDSYLTSLCARSVLCGKYDAGILQQLAECYEGSITELDAIYHAAEGFEMDTFGLCERMILQMLFTGADISERTDLLRQYVREGGSSRVTGAFLHRCACSYVMADEPIHISVIQMIGYQMRQKERISEMCEIAYLEYYARNRESRNTDTDRNLLQIAEKMYRSGKYLPVLKHYGDILPQAVYLMDKSFVVCRRVMQKEVWIHFRTVKDGAAQGAYRSVKMRCICDGIHAAEFLLFPGETLQYYITLRQQDDQILESGFVKPAVSEQDEKQSRYAMLSAVCERQLEKKEAGSLPLQQEYMKMQFYVSRLFGPLNGS